MARSRTIEAKQQAEPAATPLDSGFGAEFRELARQRRFVRASDPAEREDSFWSGAPADAFASAAPAPAPAPAAPASTPAPAAPAPAAPAPAPEPARRADRRAALTARLDAAAIAPPTPTPSSIQAPSPLVRAPRISEDQRATLLELARMSDRLVQSREDLAVATTRATHLESELATTRAGLAAANDRLMASRVLVQDAQRTTRELAERAAWLEGRVEMLQDALELAVNASVVTRWKWRREQRARSRA